jgi:hypothetical protein
MLTEEFIREVARNIAGRLDEPKQVQSDLSRTLIVFGSEASDSLQAAAKRAYPDAELLIESSTPERSPEKGIDSYSTILLIAPSLDLASKIAQLQTHSQIANFIVRSLLARKRVVAALEGMLASSTIASSAERVPVGIFRAVEELRNKLIDLGIEIVTNISNLSKATKTYTVEPQPAQFAGQSRTGTVHLPVLNSQLAQHPSRERIRTNEELGDFIEFLQNKQCTMEKNKPCDQCDICNTLGF